MIKGNDSNKIIENESKKFIGIGNFKVLGINLDFEELKDLNFMRSKEPVYNVSFGDRSFSKITFYVHNIEHDLKLPVDFLISDRDKVTTTGKYYIINNYGQSCVASSVEDSSMYDWFRQEGARFAKEGEIELVDFLVHWLNVKNFVSKTDASKGEEPDQAYISDWSKLLDGNVTELHNYLTNYPNNEIKCLVYIKKNFMNIYTSYFERASIKQLTNWIKFADKKKAQGYPIAEEYVIGNLREYVPGEVVADNFEDVFGAASTLGI